MQSILVSRYEFKYLVRPAQLAELRRRVLQYCEPDVYAEGAEWYGIQSLYLDTGNFRFFRESAESALERMKVRVRGYATGDGPVKLEVKRRWNDVVTKRSLLLPRGDWKAMRAAGLQALPRESAAFHSDFAAVVEAYRAAPRLLVTYERQAFFSDVDDYVRVTFDRRIQCQPMREWRLEGNPRAWRLVDDPAPGGADGSPYVMELKFTIAPPAWLHDMVTSFGLVRRGFSKYARGLRRTMMEREPAWDFRAAMPGLQPAWRMT